MSLTILPIFLGFLTFFLSHSCGANLLYAGQSGDETSVSNG